MSLDGIMLNAIKNELEDKLIGARIDKIYQPEAKLLTFTLRQKGQNLDLLISAFPQEARIHITENNFENPIKPPDFAMLLRKYLLRGVITSIKQPDFERILLIKIKRHNFEYTLITEIMGKYSNIILIDENGIILDAIKRITREISREREVYPGIGYKYPPKQDKLNPLKVTRESFMEKIPDNFNKYSYKAIMFNFRGIGPDMAREIIKRSGLNPDQPYSSYNEEEKEKIWQGFNNLFNNVKKGDFQPTIALDEDNNISYFSAFPLKHKEGIAKELAYSETGLLFDYYHENKIKKSKIDKIGSSLENIVQKYLKKNRKKQNTLKKRLADGKRAEEYKKMGELLTASIYKFEGRAEEIEVIDYYDPEQKKITIPLNPELSASENAQRYFKKYNKAKRSVSHIKKQLGKLRHEERYLEQVKLNIEQAETRSDLSEIKSELKAEGYIKDKRRKKKKNKGREKPLPPHKFKSSQGYDILVGRNNRQNDNLTKKIANQQDIWLHIKELAGSHVIIRNHTGGEVPPETLEEAAVLAAYYSKGRQSVNVAIDYTEVKNVNKPRGAKPGLVYYENYQTLYVNPDEELVARLKDSSD